MSNNQAVSDDLLNCYGFVRNSLIEYDVNITDQSAINNRYIYTNKIIRHIIPVVESYIDSFVRNPVITKVCKTMTHNMSEDNLFSYESNVDHINQNLQEIIARQASLPNNDDEVNYNQCDDDELSLIRDISSYYEIHIPSCMMPTESIQDIQDRIQDDGDEDIDQLIYDTYCESN
ncbi:MAG: hypothetical protein EBV73_04800 [Rhodocyclales bacterium]|nr:hypothetical protein [Rhodocyclales bacterium]